MILSILSGHLYIFFGVFCPFFDWVFLFIIKLYWYYFVITLCYNLFMPDSFVFSLFDWSWGEGNSKDNNVLFLLVFYPSFATISFVFKIWRSLMTKATRPMYQIRRGKSRLFSCSSLFSLHPIETCWSCCLISCTRQQRNKIRIRCLPIT